MEAMRKRFWIVLAALLSLATVLAGMLIWRSMSQHRYLVLIGETATPPYENHLVGEHYGPSHSIMVHGQEKFGRLSAQWSGDEGERVFTSGGIVLTNDAPVLKLEGDLNRELNLFVLKRLNAEEFSLLKKAKLSGRFQTEIRMED